VLNVSALLPYGLGLMQILREVSSATSEIIEQLTRVSECLQLLTANSDYKEQVLDAGSRFQFGHDFPQQLIQVTEGVATIALAGKPVLLLSEGDLLGLPAEHHVPDLTLETDFAIGIRTCALSDVKQRMHANEDLQCQWERIQELRQALFFRLYAEHCAGEDTVFPSIRHYNSGAVIIEEGTAASEVYTMVEGEADVYHLGTQVGTIGEDEIFGALAALSGTPRTATVTARTRCMVAVLPVQSFKILIQHRPYTTEKLIRDFARKIVQLNERIAGK
jgi:hypothetical protein